LAPRRRRLGRGWSGRAAARGDGQQGNERQAGADPGQESRPPQGAALLSGRFRLLRRRLREGAVARQGGLDLQPHEVIGTVKPTPPIRIGDGEPLVADQRQQHIAGSDRSGDGLDEVVAKLDGIHVFEDLAAAEVDCEPIEQPARRIGGVLPPIADEDPSGNFWRRRSHDLCLATPILISGEEPDHRAVHVSGLYLLGGRERWTMPSKS
jgi:hypothetical protein